MNYSGLFFLFIFGTQLLWAQEPPKKSASLDTVRLLSDEPLKSPMGAVLRSAVIPGLGQFYTESYVKSAVFFTFGTYFTTRSIYFHNRLSDSSLDGDARSSARTKRNNSNWLLAITYISGLLDAYVDAYLFEFDKAVEIAVHAPETRSGGTAVALSVQVSF